MQAKNKSLVLRFGSYLDHSKWVWTWNGATTLFNPPLPDTTSPMPGIFGATTSIGYTGFTLNWTAGTDDLSSQTVLEYLVCSAGNSAAIDTILECENADVAMIWTANKTSLRVEGKTHSVTYYYNVLVKDQAGNKSLFTSISVRTLNAFISSWTTSNPGASTNTQVTLPLDAAGSYNFTVDWGDASSSIITAWNDAATTHTYVSEGTYVVTVTGTLTGFSFNNAGDAIKLIEISQWGPLRLGNSGGYFYGAQNLRISATDILNLTGTTSLSFAFGNCFSLTAIPRMNEWNTAAVVDMNNMFYDARSFNEDIGSWNTGAVTNMERMFFGASSFNQDIGSWNTAAVTDMSGLFFGASVFNQPIGNWNTAAVTTMTSMFYMTTAFNQPIGNWNTSAVTSMANMFRRAGAFNQSIGSWNTAAVTSMNSMFYNATAFNQPIGNWNTAAITDMEEMFADAAAFNQPIGSWNTAAVTVMEKMFANTSSFNQSIGNWNTASVDNMTRMFANASAFNQNIGTWNVSAVSDMYRMFFGAQLSQANYDSLLIGWSALTLQNGVDFDAGSSQYSAGAAAAARTNIGNNFGWTISDGGQN